MPVASSRSSPTSPTPTPPAGCPPRVDVLVNNAGIQHVSPIHEFPVEVFERIHRVMLLAPFRLARHVLPHMYATGWGRVVNVSSVHGLRASPFKAAYVSAKHGLEGLSKVIALEGAEHGVTSNCINPAYVRTPLVEKQITDQAKAHGIPESEVVETIMLAPAARKRLIEPSRGRRVRELPLHLRRRLDHRRVAGHGRRLDRPLRRPGRPPQARRATQSSSAGQRLAQCGETIS